MRRLQCDSPRGDAAVPQQQELPFPEVCEYCGEEVYIDLFEVWGFDFMLEYCCEDAEESWRAEQERWTQQEWTDFVLSLDTTPVLGPRRTAVGDGRVRLHYGLTLVDDPPQALCKAFIFQYHRHLPRVHQWRWGHAVYNGPELVGVAWVGTPASRVMMQHGYVEVNRCCVAPESPSDLVRNACSMLYGAAARRAKKEGYKGVLTYTRADELGVSVKAAGFQILPMPSDKEPGIARGKKWGHSGRHREANEIIDKTRWVRRF